MSLACSMSSATIPSQWLLVWAVVLLAPVAAFLALPKLLPLARELRWTRARVAWPLAWLASRLDGDRAGAAAWGARMRRGLGWDVEAAHEGGRAGVVAREPSLLRRARRIGWVAGAVPPLIAAGVTALVWHERGAASTAVTVGAIAAALVSAWIARVGAASAGFWAQALALGRGGAGRLGAGLLVGGGYGALTGATAALAAGVVFVPLVSLLTLEPPGLVEGLAIVSAVTAVGAASGALLVGALGARAAFRARQATVSEATWRREWVLTACS